MRLPCSPKPHGGSRPERRGYAAARRDLRDVVSAESQALDVVQVELPPEPRRGAERSLPVAELGAGSRRSRADSRPRRPVTPKALPGLL
jgi:hypothetical protein